MASATPPPAARTPTEPPDAPARPVRLVRSVHAPPLHELPGGVAHGVARPTLLTDMLRQVKRKLPGDVSTDQGPTLATSGGGPSAAAVPPSAAAGSALLGPGPSHTVVRYGRQ